MEKLEREYDDSLSFKNDSIERVNSNINININSNNNSNSNSNVNNNYIGNETNRNLRNGMSSTIVKIKRMSKIIRKNLFVNNKSVESSNGLLLMQSGNILKNNNINDNIFNGNIPENNNSDYNTNNLNEATNINNITNKNDNKNNNNKEDKKKKNEKEKKEKEENEENIIKERIKNK